MLVAQAMYLRLAQAGVGEHAGLLVDEAEIRRAERAQLLDEARAHRVDARTHAAQLLLPARAQLSAAEHAGDQRGAVGGRAGIDRADHLLDLRLQPRRLVTIGTDHRQRAHALAVQRERLGVRVGDHERLDARLRQYAHRGGILFGAAVEALVSHVDERQQLALTQQFDQLCPLRGVQVHAGGVVAARMQQHHGAGFHPAQVLQHAGEVQAVAGRVVIAVFQQLEAGGAKHHVMVAPARVADGDLRLRADHLLEQIGRHAQRGAAADGLRGSHATGREQRRFGAEHQLLAQPVVRGQAVDRQVAARLRGGGQRQLHLVHRGQQRDAPLFVDVDADAQVDLVRPRVRQIGFGEAQDRIARGHFNGGKEGHDRYSMGGKAHVGAVDGRLAPAWRCDARRNGAKHRRL